MKLSKEELQDLIVVLELRKFELERNNRTDKNIGVIDNMLLKARNELGIM